jgi:hypothetical protein
MPRTLFFGHWVSPNPLEISLFDICFRLIHLSLFVPSIADSTACFGQLVASMIGALMPSRATMNITPNIKPSRQKSLPEI